MEKELSIDRERLQDTKSQVEEWKEKINEELRSDFKMHIRRAEKIHPEGARMVKYLEDYTMRGGKRIRPTLIIAGYRASGGGDDNILPLSVSIEALQSYILGHDDMMDEDPLRREGPTLHELYRRYHEQNFFRGNSKKFGDKMAIIAGDLAGSFSVWKLATRDLPPSVKAEAIKEMEKMHRYTGYGQTLDLYYDGKSLEETSEEDILKVHRYKTAQYTIRGGLQIGAILGGATESQKNLLHKYGMKVGTAFQIRDDILGLYGDEEKKGKTDSDLKEGKKTLLVLKAYQEGDQEQRQILKEALGKENISEEEIERVRKIVKETGSYQYSKRKLKKLIKEGKKILEDHESIDDDYKYLLKGIADYIGTREV